jgi:hypothetical protein
VAALEPHWIERRPSTLHEAAEGGGLNRIKAHGSNHRVGAITLVSAELGTFLGLFNLGSPRIATVCDHIEPHRGDEYRFW